MEKGDLVTSGTARAPRLTGYDKPCIEIEDDALGILALFVLQRESCAILIFDPDHPDAQRADVVALRNFRFLDDFRPGVDRVSGERRRNMPATVDRSQMKGIAEA